MKGRWRTLGIALAFLVLAIPARAETIQITSGGFVWSRPIGGGPIPISFEGQGFTFGGVGSSTGVFWPWIQCATPDCFVGTTVDLLSTWSGGDLPGAVTYNGVTYTPLGGLDPSHAGLLARWTGSLTIPDGFTGGAVSAPFLFDGRFSGPAGSGIVALLTGHGTATLQFIPFPPFDPPFPDTTGAFLLQSASYQFDAAAPVPEPASMVLIGSGLAGLAALRRRRRGGGDR